VSRLTLLTASRSAGKTTFCLGLAVRARAAGWRAGGLLSPAVFEAGVKTGIQVHDLESRASRRLARRAADGEQPGLEDLAFGGWLFDRRALAWGDQVLAACPPCDLFILDEIGPLELLHGGGWIQALPALRRGAYRLGIAVVRPELVEEAGRVLPVERVVHLSPTLSPDELLAPLKENS
jgi:hypothetical protein